MCVPCVCLVEYIYRIFVISISLSMLMQGICLMPLLLNIKKVIKESA